MSEAGVQSARSNSSPEPASAWLRLWVASSKSLFIRSCSVTRSCKGFHCWDIFQSSSSGRKRRVSLKLHHVAIRRHSHGLPGQNLTLQELHRKRVLNQRLNCALQWSSTVCRVVTFAHQKRFRRRLQHEHHVALVQHCRQTLKLHIDDLADLFARELVEDDDVVDTIQKLRFEMQPQLLNDSFTHLLLITFRRLDLTRAEVRSHDQNGVLEIDCSTFRVRQSAVVKNLKQDVENIRMRLLDFVEEDDRVRTTTNCFGKLSTLVVTNISRRCSDHARDRMFLHVL